MLIIIIKTILNAARFYVLNKEFLLEIYIKPKFTYKTNVCRFYLFAFFPFLWVETVYTKFKGWWTGKTCEINMSQGTIIILKKQEFTELETKLEQITKQRNFYRQATENMIGNKANDMMVDKFVFLDTFLEKLKKAESFHHAAFIHKFKGYKEDWESIKKHKTILENEEIGLEIERTIKEIEDSL